MLIGLTLAARPTSPEIAAVASRAVVRWSSQRRSLVSLALALGSLPFGDASLGWNGEDEPLPVSVDGSLTIERLLSQPQLVTPTGISTDAAGRIWVIECHTHFRPDDYQGPETDRILIAHDDDRDGDVDRTTLFHEGSRATMGLHVEASGTVLVATRGEIFRLADTDGDLIADRRTTLAHLDTAGDYPHNGLSGFAVDPLGGIFFGFGENLGAEYALIGADGTRLTGGGEGGNIYRIESDGSGLVRWATGFWNPFHLTVDDFGRLFAVDNDPDWRPPCRLLHVVRDGDYGYRFALGRRGTHPFTDWFGERPDRLGMIAGTGEAPSGIVSYRGGNLAEADDGALLVTSWGLHTIERYRLIRRGATFTSLAEIRIKGGEDFRPVGLAVAADGALIASDWVKRSYPLHGHGALWRFASAEPLDRSPVDAPDPIALLLAAPSRSAVASAAEQAIAAAEAGAPGTTTSRLIDLLSDREIAPWRRAILMTSLHRAGRLDSPSLERTIRDCRSADLRTLAVTFAAAQGWTRERFVAACGGGLIDAETEAETFRRLGGAADLTAARDLLDSEDPCLRQAAVALLARQVTSSLQLDANADDSEATRVGLACAAARRDDPATELLLPKLLDDRSSIVRWVALRRITERGSVELRPQVERGLGRDGLGTDEFEAILATLEQLDGVSGAAFEGNQGALLASIVRGERTASAGLIALALERIDRIALRDRVDGVPAGLEFETLRSLLRHESTAVRIAAVGLLGRRHAGEGADDLLLQTALEPTQETAVRRAAVEGIADPNRLVEIAENVGELRSDAVRYLRGSQLDQVARDRLKRLPFAPHDRAAVERVLSPEASEARPAMTDIDAWVNWLGEIEGDAERGERWFRHSSLARCATCHQVDGRGGAVGPELGRIGTMGRRRLVESLLEPSREIAPRYTAWIVETIDGSIRSGLLETERGEQQFYVDSNGVTFTADHDEIVSLAAADRSLMPDDLLGNLTRDEIADLIAYLESLR